MEKTEARDREILVAAESGDTETIKRLLKEGADVEAKDTYWRTPMMLAAHKGHTEIIKVLLEARAWCTEARDKGGLTALMYAACGGHTEAIRLLLKAGADIEASTDPQPIYPTIDGQLEVGAGTEARDGWTPLMWAAGFGRAEAIKVLLGEGAKKEIKNKDGKTEVVSPVIARQAEETEKKDGKTAFDIWRSEQKDHCCFDEIAELLRP
ncbi:MAG: ankyrin repeat domain-containing protein [Candidatus Dadabacteria bacterium]|nr:ankyrin repeat domain-containing protein [Candidatus Dadabacteria bacterium]